MNAVQISGQFTFTPAVGFVSIERLAMCAQFRDAVVVASPLGGWLFARSSVLPVKGCRK